jgi:hypothetical protein
VFNRASRDESEREVKNAGIFEVFRDFQSELTLKNVAQVDALRLLKCAKQSIIMAVIKVCELIVVAALFETAGERRLRDAEN